MNTQRRAHYFPKVAAALAVGALTGPISSRIIVLLYRPLTISISLLLFSTLSGVQGAPLIGYDQSSNTIADSCQTYQHQLAQLEQLIIENSTAFHRGSTAGSFDVANEAQGYDAKIDGSVFELHPSAHGPMIKFDLLGMCRGEETGILPTQLNSGTIHKNELLIPYEGLSVQFLNCTSGLRQNFIINERPKGHGMPGVRINIHTELSIELNSAANEVQFTDSNQQVLLTYSDLRVWDATGKVLPSRMELTADQLVLRYDDDGDVSYPITVDPISLTPNRLLIGAQALANFGNSVATAGDLNGDGYSDVVIGAPNAALGQNAEGAAFVYYGSATGIPAVPSVTLEINQQGAQFGSAVNTAGDANGDGYSDLIVGAFTWEDTYPSQISEGGVFVYYGSAIGIGTVPDDTLQTNNSGDILGANIAPAGDVNGDGYGDVIAGAYLADRPSTDEGSAFVFLGSATGLSSTFAHHLQGNQATSHFGRGVGAAGDINGDGYSDVIVGAPRYSLFSTRDGAIFIYYGSAAGLGPVFPAPDLIIGGNGTASGQYGWSVAGVGDVNGDGFTDVATGAYRHNGGQSQEGFVYVYHGSAAGLNTTPAVIVESNGTNAWMGRSVGTAGDMNGDGYADMIVGMPTYSNGQGQEGAGRVYLGSATGISNTVFYQFELNQAGANLGESVYTAGDVNGDGYSDIVLGARIYGAGGGAFIYHGGPYNISTTPTVSSGGSAVADQLGTSVASAGDVNGDGYSDVIIGAPFASNGQAGEGLAYVHLGSANGTIAAPHRVLEANVAGQEFGFSVATAGDVNGDGYGDVIVGAPSTGGGAGAAYIYLGGATGLNSVPSLTITGAAANGTGYSVSTAGDVNLDGYSDILVGSSGNRVNVHLGSATGLAAAPQVVLTGTGGFGQAVSYAGDVNGDGTSDILIGALNNGTGGRAYVYHGVVSTGIVAPASTTITSGTAGALFGSAVSGAEDVNGDGFSDIVIGSPTWSNGQVEEGAAMLYYGSAGGIVTGTFSLMQWNAVGGHMGTSVAAAGDTNGDGYADVCIGVPDATSGQAGEGLVAVYRGRATGIFAAPTTLQSDVIGQRSGASVAGAGDVDGDGYSDVIAGAPNYSVTNPDEGAFALFHGNLDNNVVRRTRQYQADLVSPLAANSQDYSNTLFFGIGQLARSYMHRSDARLQWEVVFEGQPFSGNPITNSVMSTGQGATWTDLGVNGVELKQLITKNSVNVRFKWRVRIEQRAVHMIDGQRYGRWFYGYASNRADIGVLPIELIHFAGQNVGSANRLDWTTVSEKNSATFVVERSSNASDFYSIGELEAAGDNVGSLDYVFMDEQPPSSIAYYRLRMLDRDGSYEYSEVITIAHADLSPTIYPIPAGDQLNIVLPDIMTASEIHVYDATGRSVLTQPLIDIESRAHTIGTQHLPKGLYTLVVEDANGTPLSRSPFVK